ncbi:MAG: hypothetical protein A07HR67_02759 [uncultured archaeon A07HR67]|nr:MAG: hypothetical protein A07HR67_02759 [uncultured archaeon A07HR67]
MIRNNDIEDISTNKTGSALTGGPAGIGIRGDYGTDGNPGIEIRNNTIDTVENTSGGPEPTGITLKSFDGDAGFGFDSNGNLTSDPSSPPATDTDIINNDIRNITSNGGFATKGISVSGEFRDVDIIGNALDTIESPGGDARAITLSENSNNGGPFNFDIDDDGSGERLGPQDFTIENNEIVRDADDPRSVNVGGYETLGSNSVSGNIINSGAVTRFAGDQDGFQPGDEDTLNVTGNTFTDATADTYISLSNKSDLDAVFSDNTFQFSPNPVVNGSRIVSTGVRFNDQTFSGSTNQVTIERVAAADTSDFVLVTHRSSPGDNGNDIVDEVSEIGNKIGSSDILTGTSDSVAVDLTKNLDEDVTEVTETQTLITMLHVANDSGGTNFGNPITRNGAPVFDQAEITIN